MIIRNEAGYLRFFAYLVERPMKEGMSILKFTISYFTFSPLLAEKRMYV